MHEETEATVTESQGPADDMSGFFAHSEEMGATPLTVWEIEDLGDAELDDRVWLRWTTLVDTSSPHDMQAAPEGVRAYLATRVFEWEVRNGGLHQYFFNHPEPAAIGFVLDGYSLLGLEDARRVVEEEIAPLAEAEAAWRESLRDGTIKTFFESYVMSDLPDMDVQVESHDAARLAYVRQHAELFAA